MQLPEVAAVVAAALLVVVALFQLALAVGLPWGRAAYGGQHRGALPTGLRVASAAAFVLWSVVALGVLRRGGLDVPSPLPDGWLGTAGWVLVAVMALALVANTITPSRVERALWAPTSAVTLAALVTLNLTA